MTTEYGKHGPRDRPISIWSDSVTHPTLGTIFHITVDEYDDHFDMRIIDEKAGWSGYEIYHRNIQKD